MYELLLSLHAFEWIETSLFLPGAVFLSLPLLYILHFYGNFVMQNDFLGVRKYNDKHEMFEHLYRYTIPFLLFVGPLFALITFFTHWAIDHVISSQKSRFSIRRLTKNLFVSIGFDELMHHIQLYFTWLVVSWAYIYFILNNMQLD